jgi:hypothetical protein
MRVNAIGHATWLLETSVGTILTDPVFFDPFESGANVSYPKRKVDVAQLPKIDCVFLSHRHFDHFDVRTLATLDRNATVFYPAGEELIEAALDGLGFQRRRALEPWAKARLHDVEIVATPSHVDWPELGLVIRDDGTTLWSLIDTVIDVDILRTLRQQVGRVDCLLAQYSPLFQYELRDPTRLKSFDLDEYRWLLEIVGLADPQVVIPSAGGVRYAKGEWQNTYGFPVPPHRFLADLRQVAPDRRCVLLEPGDRMDLAFKPPVAVRQCLDFVRTTQEPGGYSRWALDPAVGIPPFRDTNPLDAPVEEAVRCATEYITRRLVDDLLDPSNAEALAEWRRWRAFWRLDLYVPSHENLTAGPARSWFIDLTGAAPRLIDSAPPDVAGWTAVNATGLYDVLHGRCSSYGYLFMDQTRHATRAHAVDGRGVSAPEDGLPEPLLAALTGPRDLDALYVSAQLEQWA